MLIMVYLFHISCPFITIPSYASCPIFDGSEYVHRYARTGTHTVADLHCASCRAALGWMYIKAPNGEQRYKEGELFYLAGLLRPKTEMGVHQDAISWKPRRSSRRTIGEVVFTVPRSYIKSVVNYILLLLAVIMSW